MNESRLNVMNENCDRPDRRALLVAREGSGALLHVPNNLLHVPNNLFFQRMFRVSGARDRTLFEEFESRNSDLRSSAAVQRSSDAAQDARAGSTAGSPPLPE